MKMQISYDIPNLEKALQIAQQTAQFADILEVGSPLIYSEGMNAVTTFKKNFPNKKIFADPKIVDRVNVSVKMFTQSGADYISVLCSTSNYVIKKAADIAHASDAKIALDLLGANAMEQIIMDAKTLNVDILILHRPHDDGTVIDLISEWDIIRGNTNLPIFLAGGINKNNINKVLELKPQGIIIGTAITQAGNPAQEAEHFKSLL